VRSTLEIGLGTLLICLLVWAGSFQFHDGIDRSLLLAVNGSSRAPGLDGFMILVTDFSVPYVATVLSLWGLGIEALQRGWAFPRTLEISLRVLGCLIALALAAWLIPTYTHRAAPAIASLLVIAGLWWAGGTYRNLPKETFTRLRRTFWLTVVSIVLVEIAMHFLGPLVVQRPRPLAKPNAAWNAALHIVEDEYVRHGTSYVSGHAAALFAMLTPLMWAVRRPVLKVALFSWAVLHALSRVYVAAHYPYCALMGSFLGFAIATLVVWTAAAGEKKAENVGVRVLPPM
jgi:membrane-associated phospholipid phosphatase